MRILFIIILSSLALSACDQTRSNTVQVGENTFVHKSRVYRVIENQITELGDLKSDNIPRSEVLKSQLKDYGLKDMDYVRKGAVSNLEAVYRGDVLYFKYELHGMNDLRDRYTNGYLTINFNDDYGFLIHASPIGITDLTRIIDDEGKTLHFEYNGKTQMSAEIYTAITSYSVSSSLRERGRYGY